MPSTTITDTDISEIRRISANKSIRKLSSAIRKDLDKETLAKMISAYLVLKANGHSDRDFVSYLTRKETKGTLKLGFKMALTMTPSLLTDHEFRSLVLGTRKQMKKEKEAKEQKQREPQLEATRTSKNRAKIGPLTVTVSSDAASEKEPEQEKS